MEAASQLANATPFSIAAKASAGLVNLKKEQEGGAGPIDADEGPQPVAAAGFHAMTIPANSREKPACLAASAPMSDSDTDGGKYPSIFACISRVRRSIAFVRHLNTLMMVRL